MPTVSVIASTYNRAHLVARAIRSVLGQTYQDFELIVVDDASTDGTEAVIKSFDDERLIYIRHEHNSGGPATPRNTGLRAARGELIAFLDDDDEWLPNKLEKQVRAFDDAPQEVGVVYAVQRMMQKDGSFVDFPPPGLRAGGDVYHQLLRGSFVGSPIVLVRRECFEEVGLFDERLRTLEDWEMSIRLAKRYQFRGIDERLSTAFYSEGGVNKQSGSAQAEALRLISERHMEDIAQDRRLLGSHYYGIGIDLCATEEFKAGRRYLLKAVRANPRDSHAVFLAFISLFGRRVYARVIAFRGKFHRGSSKR